MQQKIQFLGGPLDGHSTECDVPFGMTTVILDVIIKRSRVSYMFEIKTGGKGTAEYKCRRSFYHTCAAGQRFWVDLGGRRHLTKKNTKTQQV